MSPLSASDPDKVLTGYTGWPSYAPGDQVPLHLSGNGHTRISLVRLRHGDTSPHGPGLRFEKVAGCPEQIKILEPQPLARGSYFCASECLPSAASLSVWLFPTLWPAENATIFHAGRFRLTLDAAGHVQWKDAHLSGQVGCGIKLVRHVWQCLVASFDSNSGRLSLHWVCGNRPHRHWECSVQNAVSLVGKGDVLFLAAAQGPTGIEQHFDGKIGAPSLWAAPLSSHDVAALVEGQTLNIECVARWEMGRNRGCWRVEETIGNAPGDLINAPTRGVTGHLWDGTQDDPAIAPDQYDAVHFHHDDLADARWPITSTFRLPTGLPSGVYAAWLRDDHDREDWLPFIVRTSGSASASLAVLMPTMTYLAYANEAIFPPHQVRILDPRDEYVRHKGLLSLYNFHADSSGVSLASWRRPLTNLRPDYRYWLTGHPHGLGADLYLLDWLDQMGIAYNLLTDHDLHEHDKTPLHPYHVLATGAHPEYWTSVSIKRVYEFLEGGGRLAYLGGNGFAARVGVHCETPYVLELRRRLNGEGLWDAEPGEMHLTTTGEQGGYWRHLHPRGRAVCGVDISAMGFSQARPFRRLAASHDSRVAFVFAGIDSDYVGTAGLHMGGAAGYEVDSADYAAGTPAHALILARAEGFTEYVSMDQRGNKCADMLFFETPAGGAVFSVGSITWSGCLSHNDYYNDVSRITANVLNRFLDPSPFVWPVE